MSKIKDYFGFRISLDSKRQKSFLTSKKEEISKYKTVNVARKISEIDLNWADWVLVMENQQRRKIWDLFNHLELPEIEILEIPDDYEFMDPELVEILTDKINETLKTNYQL